ncbi:acid sphingomyelinase-like phosphodiesterase 3a isoform X2 [Latimeria chalumnae]|nr:PREDICTED: acid sphingomyelinase-like phosphodiesterase 3a isoform X2 [Latimeria chalumnae]|eukprot:XP_005990512.1 PREDICTED: acid sphingomyelinase-like phosphodiesterase 3a isoform X2 [Latimeria chalumnae]
MTSTIRKFFPSLQVFPALGNHDYWPQDQFPAHASKLYNAVADLWKPWLTDNAISTLRRGGFYTQVFKANFTQQPLRIISLNTNLYYSPNKVTVNMTDPAQQFEWLEGTLENARLNQEKVYIIAHVPVGYLPYARNVTAVREHYNERMVKIFRKYSNVIAGQFFGHTHRDSIMVLLDEKGNPINSLFVAPAVTPIKDALEITSNNPGFRLYKYNSKDYSMLDLWQYYLNLTEANAKDKPEWRLEYIMTQAYGIKDLQPQSLYELSKQFQVAKSELFKKYYHYFLVSSNNRFFCESICQVYQVCAILYLDSASYRDCIRLGLKETLHRYNKMIL